MTRQPLGIHGYIHGATDQDPILDNNWITVGTPGLDGVDTEIAENLYPYNNTPWVPFQNGWTQAGGDEQLLQFVIGVGGWVRIRGVPTGGADNTVVFTLPTGYRPLEKEHFTSAGRVAGSVVTWRVETNGEVVYETQIGGGSGGGGTGGAFIQFDLDNTGDWLEIETSGGTGVTTPEGTTTAGIALIASGTGNDAVFGTDGSGNVVILSSGGNLFIGGYLGNPNITAINGDGGVNALLEVENWAAGMTFSGGFMQFTTDQGFEVDADGGIYLDDNDGSGLFLTSTGGTIELNGDDSVNLFSDTQVRIGNGGANTPLFLVDADDYIFDLLNNLTINGLPTVNPGGTGRVWNSSGTLKIT